MVNIPGVAEIHKWQKPILNNYKTTQNLTFIPASNIRLLILVYSWENWSPVNLENEIILLSNKLVPDKVNTNLFLLILYSPLKFKKNILWLLCAFRKKLLRIFS